MHTPQFHSQVSRPGAADAIAQQEFFAIEIHATAEPSLLARIAQRIAWIGVELDRFSFATSRSGDSVHIEVLIESQPERADLLASHLRKLVAVYEVRLSSAFVRRTR